MTIALVASTIAGSTSGSNVTTAQINTTGANLIVLAAGSGNVAATITDSGSPTNTWSGLTQQTNGVALIRLYYCFNPSVSATHTFTASGSGQRCSLGVLAFSGVGASPFDLQNGTAAATGTSKATGTITPSENNCVVIAGASIAIGATGLSIGGGFTALTINSVAAQRVCCGIAYLIQTTAAAANPTWSWTTSSNHGVAIASFKAAASGSKRRRILTAA